MCIPKRRTFEGAEDLDVEVYRRQAEEALDGLDQIWGRIDALYGSMDFPVSVLASILGRERSLPSPSLEGLLLCEH